MDVQFVRIGAIDYEIIDKSRLLDGSDPLDGQMVHSQSQILLDDALGPSARWITLWHEILHAILVRAGYQEHDEGQMAALSYGIVEALHDNPWLAESPKRKQGR
jgi:hypothetical protein